MYLDAVLVDEPLTGGIAPMLGDQHLRTVTVLGFPNLTRPGILDALNHLGFPYRWVTRFIPLDKTEANRTLTRIRRQWFAKRKSISALLREVLYNEPAQLLDSDADNKVLDADTALQALGGDHVAFGYLTATVTVSATRPRGRGREAPRRRAGHQRRRLHHHPGEHQRRRGLARQPAGARLCQRPAAAHPHPQPRPSGAAVVGLGGAGRRTSISTVRRSSMPRPAARPRSASRPMSATSATC